MSKRIYGSKPNKVEALPNGKFRCLYNIVEKEETYPVIDPETHEPTGKTETRKIWECDWVDVDSQPTSKNLVPALIRQKYSLDDELERHRLRDEEPEAFAEYDAFVKQCQAIAKEILTNE